MTKAINIRGNIEVIGNTRGHAFLCCEFVKERDDFMFRRDCARDVYVHTRHTPQKLK
jgi:hypothetical protein